MNGNKTKKENRLVVANAGWADAIPEWLLDAVKVERLTQGFGNLINPTRHNGGDYPKVGDAEACVYLYTASLSAPLPHELGEVYLHLTAKLLKAKGIEPPDFAREKLEKGLSADEERELRRLRETLYNKRGGEISSPLFDALRSLKKELK